MVETKAKANLADEWEIAKVSPFEAKKQIKFAFKTREPIILLGETGQGKTAVVKQAAKELGEELALGGLPLEAPLDVQDPQLEKWYREVYKKNRDTGAEGLGNCLSGNLPFLHKVTEPSAKDAFDLTGLPGIRGEVQFYYRPEEIPSVPYQLGIWQLTEFNRPAARRTIRPLLNAIERRVIGEHMIPPGISFVLDMNEGDIYDVEDVKDPYFIRRASWLWVENSLEDWLLWMEGNYTSDLIRGFLVDNPTFFDSHARRIARKPYACAAVWTRIQRILDVLLPTGIDTFELLPLLAGKVGAPYAGALCEYVRKGTELGPTKILLSYEAIRDRVRQAVIDGQGLDRIANAALTAARFLLKQDARSLTTGKMITNFVLFFSDLPMDTAQNVGMEFAEERLTKDQKPNPNSAAVRRIIISEIMQSPAAHATLTRLHLVTRSSEDGGLALKA